MRDDNICNNCGDRPADADDLCQWCYWLCNYCGDRPIEAAMIWARPDAFPSQDLCFLCQEQSDREAQLAALDECDCSLGGGAAQQPV